eukprot:CAMPEP_0184497236 /NCGR_PEP_ID=MMETSP0113_2-20130426/35998_1 /TAXON_ID=91329 /ORGANISM="Norrisiella sphaerica, Strain BC52" /LENGTH=352 /DNA_ID=CAMNT_0026884245 /DNA_START=81 /DNA_END=1139 /DNA_ORIENTATION=+
MATTGTFEWLASFPSWKVHLYKFLQGIVKPEANEKDIHDPKESCGREANDKDWKARVAIANVGCGYSLLHEDLHREGFRDIVNTDVSFEAINRMKARADEKFTGMTWKMDDIRDSKLQEETFEVVIDKSTLDFLVAEKLKDALQMLFNVHKVLKLGGKYITISMHPPSIFLPLLTPHSPESKSGQQSAIEYAEVPPPSSAPPSMISTFVYCYTRTLKGSFFESLEDACGEVERRWAESKDAISAEKMCKLKAGFKARGENGTLDLKSLYEVLFKDVEPISEEYPYEDFCVDMQKFRELKNSGFLANDSDGHVATHNADGNPAKAAPPTTISDKGLQSKVTMADALKFLKKMG